MTIIDLNEQALLKYSGEMKSIDATCSINFEELDSSTLLFIGMILNFFEILLLVK